MPDSLPARPDRFHPGPEFRLLAACSWLPPQPWAEDQAETIEALCASPLDWNVFLDLMARHRVATLVHRNLDRRGYRGVPGPVREAVVRQARSASTISLLFFTELVRLAGLFRTAGIAVAALKGPSLSLRLYGDPSVRSTKDLDLLVHEEDFHRAEALLLEQGYRRTFPSFEPTRKMWARIRAQRHHYDYLHEARSIQVELHWGIHGRSPSRLEPLWSRREPLAWHGVDLDQVEDTALFALLLEHGAMHGWFRLKWLSDIAMCLTLETPSARRAFTAAARDLEVERCLAQALLLVHWFYGLELPGWLRGMAVFDDRSVALAADACEALFAPVGDPADKAWASARKTLREFRYLRKLGKGSSHWGFLGERAINPMDGAKVALPDPLFELYYVLRPFFWAWDRLSRRA
jgi:hypothetical protein